MVNQQREEFDMFIESEYIIKPSKEVQEDMFVAWEAAYAAGQIDALENAAVMSESERFLTDDASHDLCEGLGIAQNEISKELRRMAKEIGGKNL